MESTDKKALAAIRTLLWAVADVTSRLLTESGFGSGIQDQELQDMYFQLNHMSGKLTEKIGEEE